MKWFDTFVSNTLGGTGNQFFFLTDGTTPRTGRIYYKVFHGGRYDYSLLFSNIIDSTFGDGSKSHCNLVCDEWDILDAALGVCRETGAERAGEVDSFVPLTFAGSRTKRVAPGEFFTSDPVELAPEKGEYLCVQIECRGRMLPYHHESILPTFVLENGKWVYDVRVPPPGMIGCDRRTAARIGYFGDSITQGIGTTHNAYAHWNALVSEALGERFSYWNLGIGYARALDAASGGAWMYKARHVDAAVVTFGTNDVGQNRTTAQIKADLTSIVRQLKEAGVRVFLQTLPPFDRQEEKLERWEAVNAFLRDELSREADGFLDVVPLLSDPAAGKGRAKYGRHPDDTGCRVWAEALTPLMKEFLSVYR